MKRYVVGDIHGGYKALVQVLEQANFDYENDQLISLGDVCDGWSETPECIEELLEIKNLIYILGNHDEWAKRFLITFKENLEYGSWIMNGGDATKAAYLREPQLRHKHVEFLNSAPLYHLTEDNILFVHAGICPGIELTENTSYDLLWDRYFWQQMYQGKNLVPQYKEIYIGHTPTLNYPNNKGEHLKPIVRKNVINMDTGACFTGKLSMMNIDTKELFQSDKVMDLYPEEKGRNR